MGDFDQEIVHATARLLEIRARLEEKRDPVGSIDIVALADLKSAVDLLRHVLWAHLEAAIRGSGKNLEQEVQRLKMQRVTEMLQGLDSVDLAAGPEADTFLNTVHSLASSTQNRHKTHGSGGAR